MATTATAKRKRRAFPFLEGILPIDTARLPLDIIAGTTLAALAIPEVMGYSKIAEMPVATGLYTILLPMAAFAFFGSSRHLVVGADSATAAVLAAGLAGIAAAGAPGSATWVAMAGLAALICGAFMIVARLIRLGFIANFLSSSVLIGFLTGVGIQVAMGQVGGMFGVSDGSGSTLEKLATALKNIAAGETSTATLAVSVLVLVIVVGLDRVNKRIPGALIAVLVTLVASDVLNLSAKGVTTVGSVPAGLPALSLPAIPADQLAADVVALLPICFSMFILILAQSAATSRAYAMKYDDSFDENVDLIGLGIGNFAAGITGTFVVNGSPTKTEMVDSAGGRSQVAQLTTAIIVGIVLIFLTGPLSYLPNAVLAAVVFLIGLRLINWRGMERIYRLRQGEFAVALVTAAVVVVVGVEQGIILAIFLSPILVLFHIYHPHDRVLSFDATGRPSAAHLRQAVQAQPGLVVYRFGANLFYANSSRFTEEVLQLVDEADPPLRWFALDAAAIGDIDFQGAEALRQVHGELGSRGVRLVISAAEEVIRRQLDAYELTDQIGRENFYDIALDAVRAYEASLASNAPAVDTPPTGGPPGAP